MIGGHCRVWHTLFLISHAQIEVRRRFLRLTLNRLLQGGDGLLRGLGFGSQTIALGGEFTDAGIKLTVEFRASGGCTEKLIA